LIVSHESITSSAGLADLCDRLAAAERIGIDTEFVSEDTFHPELCLVQVVTEGLTAVIDPYSVADLRPFWELLAKDSHVTIIHAAREEVNFSLKAIDALPANLFDTQIAAGFCSSEYPSSYGSVVTKFLGQQPAKGEQRTDWRRRPLSTAQIDYALEDVRYLMELHTELLRRLNRDRRQEWFVEEMADWQKDVVEARTRPRWHKVSGTNGLSSRSMAIVRELWIWRQKEAEARNMPARRLLRDDLLVELAKRKSDKPDKIRAIRGLPRSMNRQMVEEISQCIHSGLEASVEGMGRGKHEAMPSQLNLLGQFLTPALTSICRNANVATSLVGTASDVRELVSYRLDFGGAEDRGPPSLARGWRAEVVGNLIDELLAGRKSIRIEDPHSEHPLEFEALE
jgi:ribonuclease D